MSFIHSQCGNLPLHDKIAGTKISPMELFRLGKLFSVYNSQFHFKESTLLRKTCAPLQM